MRWVRPRLETVNTVPGKNRCQRCSAHGETAAIAKTTRRPSNIRVARSIHCSSFNRRVFFRWAASKNRIAAQLMTTYRLRFSKWIMTGMAAAPPAMAATASGWEKITPIMANRTVNGGVASWCGTYLQL